MRVNNGPGVAEVVEEMRAFRKSAMDLLMKMDEEDATEEDIQAEFFGEPVGDSFSFSQTTKERTGAFEKLVRHMERAPPHEPRRHQRERALGAASAT